MSIQHSHTSGGGVLPKTYEKRLDVKTIRILRDLHFRSHWPSLCRRMMADELMQQDPRFEINGREFATHEVSPLFQSLIRKYYMTFFMDCYDEIMIAGVVFLRIVKSPSGDRVPLVLSSAHFGTMYDVWIRNTGGKNTYRVVKLQNSKNELITPKTMRDVIPIDHFGTAPGHSGEINSRLVSIIDAEVYYQYMMRMSLQAEYTLSNPPVITETRPEAPGALPMGEREIDYFLDGEFEHEQQKGLYRRDQAALKHVKDHFDMSYKFVETPKIHSQMGVFNNPLENNVRPLPHGHTVTSQVLPSRNTLMEEVTRTYEVQISATYGVPRALVVQDTSIRTAGAFDLVETALRSTLTYWNNIGGQLMTAVYLCIYYPEDCNWVAGITPSNGKPMTKEELFESVSKIADVKIVIPLGPHGTIEENRLLYEQGVILWDEYVMSARARNGFGALQMPEPPLITEASQETETKKRKQSEPKKNKDQ